VPQALGNKNYQTAGKYLNTGIMISLIVALLLLIFLIPAE